MSEITTCMWMKAEGKTRDCQYYGPRPREENLTPSRKYFFRAGGPRRKWKFHIWIFSHSFPSLRLRDAGSTGGTELGIWGTIVTPPPCHPALISDDGTLVFFLLALSIKAVIQPSSKGTISSNNLFSFCTSSSRCKSLFSQNATCNKSFTSSYEQLCEF